MIGISAWDYIFVRTCIFLLHLIAPLSVVYSLVNRLIHLPFHIPHVLEAWLALEAVFYLLVYLPRRNYLQKVATHPAIGRDDRRRLFWRCHSHIPNPHRYLTRWFRDAPMAEIKRENVKDFLRWGFLNSGVPDPAYDEELEEYIGGIEKLLGRNLEPGRGNAHCLRLTLDRVLMLHRSLTWYLCVFIVDTLSSIFLRYHSFDFHRTSLFQFLAVFPMRLLTLFTTYRSPARTLTYWHRPHTSRTRLPVLFLHGIGVGLYPYIPFLADLNAEGSEDPLGGQLCRKPARASEHLLSYFGSKDMGVAHTLFRRFIWSDNTLWKEDIRDHRVAVVLAGRDVIVDTNTIGAYLTGKDDWSLETGSWENGIEGAEEERHFLLYQNGGFVLNPPPKFLGGLRYDMANQRITTRDASESHCVMSSTLNLQVAQQRNNNAITRTRKQSSVNAVQKVDSCITEIPPVLSWTEIQPVPSSWPDGPTALNDYDLRDTTKNGLHFYGPALPTYIQWETSEPANWLTFPRLLQHQGNLAASWGQHSSQPNEILASPDWEAASHHGAHLPIVEAHTSSQDIDQAAFNCSSLAYIPQRPQPSAKKEVQTRKTSSGESLAAKRLQINAKPAQDTKVDTQRGATHAGRGNVRGRHKRNRAHKRVQERNRIDASKRRHQRREETEKVYSNVQDLKEINLELTGCLKELVAETHQLKMDVLQHSACECTLIHKYIKKEAERFVKRIEKNSGLSNVELVLKDEVVKL
ncbi:hypothetical protein NM208_g4188 [Fusarium decemcellulare]|uniref:Uncharacterized protein n=1 Tax=Fusarium decemcellulare TaxID=57161 RepID=A0ACC1SLJ1_9HYPO|nr:hypothetical protein NM208_g4188 [Fusarium decemcellulare]